MPSLIHTSTSYMTEIVRGLFDNVFFFFLIINMLHVAVELKNTSLKTDVKTISKASRFKNY